MELLGVLLAGRQALSGVRLDEGGTRGGGEGGLPYGRAGFALLSEDLHLNIHTYVRTRWSYSSRYSSQEKITPSVYDARTTDAYDARITEDFKETRYKQGGVHSLSCMAAVV